MRQTTHIQVHHCLAALGLLILVSSCTTTPATGEKFVMTVTQIPNKRLQLEHNPALSLALKRGVTRDDIASKRLMISGCYDLRSDGSVYTRQVLSLLQPGISVKPGMLFKTTTEQAIFDNSKSLYFGKFIQMHPTEDATFFTYKYALENRAFQCAPQTLAKNEMIVEAYFPVATYLYDDAKAEKFRNEQITDDELEQERIAIGDCGTGIESWVVWKIKLPSNMTVKVGDYIEAIAGAYEGPSQSKGALSIAVRKVAKPPISDFIPSRGRGDFTAASGSFTPYKVACNARAIPLPD